MTAGRPAASRGPRGAAEAAFADALKEHQSGKDKVAERLCRKALALDPRHAESLNLLGVLALRRSALEEAARHIGQAAALAPDHAPYHSNLGAVLRKAGRLEEALAAFTRAGVLAPESAPLPYNRAIVLRDLGRMAEAEAAYRAATLLEPRYAEAWNNLGTLLLGQGRLEEAAEACRRAMELRADYAEAHYNFGLVQRERGEYGIAAEAFRHAIALRRDYLEAQRQLGRTLLADMRPGPAEAAWRAVLALAPDAEAELCLGLALKEQNRATEAAAALDRAMVHAPTDPIPRLERALLPLPIVAADAAESAGAEAACGQALEALAAWEATNPGALGPVAGRASPFWLAYRPGNHRRLLSRYGDLLARSAAQHWAPQLAAFAHPPPVRGRVRLGIVSAHVRRHSVWDVVLRGIVAGLDRQRFEVMVYHLGIHADAETAWARGQVDGFVQGPLPAADWIARLAEDRPDILLYPEIGMDETTRLLATLRLAPLQAVSWGHPETSGLPEIDLYLSAELLEGQDAQDHYREQLVRLPGTGVVTRLPPVAALPPALALPGDREVLRLAFCQTAYKFEPADDALVARVARAAAPCRLYLPANTAHPWAPGLAAARLRATLAAEGLAEDMAAVELMPHLPLSQFYGFLEAMDLYFDCPAFSGYTTAWMAARHGLPIVTLEGPYLRQRLAAGLLRRIGQAGTVAASAEDYVAIAARLAAEARNNRVTHEARRAALREAARLLDAEDPAIIRALEEALLAAWRRRSGG